VTFKDKKYTDNSDVKLSILPTTMSSLLSRTYYGENIQLFLIKKEDCKLFYDHKGLYPITFSMIKDKPLRFTYEQINKDNNFLDTVKNFNNKYIDKFPNNLLKKKVYRTI